MVPDSTEPPDREPSPARSKSDWHAAVESSCSPSCIRKRCEPGTARGPVLVSRCARLSLPPRVSPLLHPASPPHAARPLPLLGRVHNLRLKQNAARKATPFPFRFVCERF